MVEPDCSLDAAVVLDELDGELSHDGLGVGASKHTLGNLLEVCALSRSDISELSSSEWSGDARLFLAVVLFALLNGTTSELVVRSMIAQAFGEEAPVASCASSLAVLHPHLEMHLSSSSSLELAAEVSEMSISHGVLEHGDDIVGPGTRLVFLLRDVVEGVAPVAALRTLRCYCSGTSLCHGFKAGGEQPSTRSYAACSENRSVKSLRKQCFLEAT